MSTSYIELVPRSADSLEREIAQIDALGIPCDGFNLPELRSPSNPFLTTEEMMALRRNGRISPEKDLVLHMRTREKSAAETIARMTRAFEHGVTSALLVTGDAHAGDASLPTHTHDVLSSIQTKIAGGTIAIAADLYHDRWGRWTDKIPAIDRGIIDAVFTQPIFHVDTLDDVGGCTERSFSREKIFAGITWITTGKSRAYWRDRNAVPETLLPTGESDATIRQNSLAQAADVLRASRVEGYSTYTMLMRGTMEDLHAIFSMAENIREV